jgi:hypothetical protein
LEVAGKASKHRHGGKQKETLFFAIENKNIHDVSVAIDCGIMKRRVEYGNANQ